jgi:hypothetical protein
MKPFDEFDSRDWMFNELNIGLSQRFALPLRQVGCLKRRSLHRQPGPRVRVTDRITALIVESMAPGCWKNDAASILEIIRHRPHHCMVSLNDQAASLFLRKARA